ncbi:hypothetical protein CNEO4_1210053 [Clostridium neonatale]|uniref:Uncharacterized protein n=1 Tax=Clostridium neonatale TaxID=137838 RepID=A0AA86JDA7_9CLOT|nr:hypothetical protein CNEO_40156 [Clostridium neonatale]CAI3580014.1 hypothetical protein CNEO4_1210053 [Clostridium neonatale]CAI3585862.1 hypothetical protein CNEO3_180035 [Clostridium neonatale]CAI3712428.1 hypothetical protein CNEO4_880006 [Clostridium neonatale]
MIRCNIYIENMILNLNGSDIYGENSKFYDKSFKAFTRSLCFKKR